MLDIFTECKKYERERKLLDYLWTDLVDEHLRESVVNGVVFNIVSPEDVVILKTHNPREKDKTHIKMLEQLGLDNDYLQKRFEECNLSINK